MPRLIAVRPILYGNVIYQSGEAVPTNSPAMRDAWLEAKSARWEDDPVEAVKELGLENLDSLGFEELKQYAAELGIPTAGDRSKKAVAEKIRAALAETGTPKVDGDTAGKDDGGGGGDPTGEDQTGEDPTGEGSSGENEGGAQA